MPTALITGITGQDGSHLADFLLKKGYRVIGMVRRTSTFTFERIAHIKDDVTLVSGDMLDSVSLIHLLQEHKPTEVYNLAAQSFVQTSWAQPVFTGEVTALSVTRLLEAIRVANADDRASTKPLQARCLARCSRCRSGRRRRSTRAARMVWRRCMATGSR